MSPDEKYAEHETAVEKQRLKQIQSTLTPQQEQEIVEATAKLEEHQTQIGGSVNCTILVAWTEPNVLTDNTHTLIADLSSLPTLRITDIPREAEAYDIEFSNGTPDSALHAIPIATNGLVYMRAMFSLDTLPPELRVYLPLFCSVCNNLLAS
jgi:presequence protease